MAVLLGVINALGMSTPEECSCPFEAEALGLIYANSGMMESALPFLDRAWSLAEEKEQQIRLLRTAALLHKRGKNYEIAAKLWQRLLAFAEDDLMAYEELAKHYEHRLKDFRAADRSHAERWLLLCASARPKFLNWNTASSASQSAEGARVRPYSSRLAPN